jgi:hypothetical protein
MSFSKKILSIIVLFLFVVLGTEIQAQPPNPGGGDDPDKVPITGIELLLVSGGLLGGYKLFKKTPRKSS